MNILIAVAAVVLVTAAAVVFGRSLYGQHRESLRLSTGGCAACARGERHQVFITAPPGWGALVSCTPATRSRGEVVRSAEEIMVLRARRTIVIREAVHE